MAMGYQGWAEINGTQCLVTSGSGPLTQVRLDSSAGWGGSITSTNTGIGAPRVYDFSVNEGSIGIELSDGFGAIIKGLIANRSNPFSLSLHPCADSDTTFAEVWWTSIGLNASEGSPITVDLSFMAIEAVREYNAGYINNRTGERGCSTIPYPLNPSGANLVPVPYWKSNLTGGVIGSGQATTWSVSFSQDIQKIFQCGATGKDPVAPIILGFGPMNAELQFTLFINGAWTYVQNGSAVVTIGDGTSMTFSQLEGQSVSHDIVGQSDIATVSATYQAYNYA